MVRDQIIYVELKSGYDDNGPAWIGRCSLSRSGQTIYFNGKAFKATQGGRSGGNYFDIETGDAYWISGVKKTGEDRHWAGSGSVMIDESVVQDYLALTGSSRLDPKKFNVVRLDHSDVADRTHEIENRRLE